LNERKSGTYTKAKQNNIANRDHSGLISPIDDSVSNNPEDKGEDFKDPPLLLYLAISSQFVVEHVSILGTVES
jgi:hypothetical protein